MARRTTDWMIGDDGEPIVPGPALPEHALAGFVDSPLIEAADELAALIEVRRQFERYRDGLD